MLRRSFERDGQDMVNMSQPEGGEWKSRFPNLWQFIACSHYEDLEPRETGTILLFVDQGKVKVCVSDRECGDVCFVTASSPEEALRRVEEGLASNDLDWRPSRKNYGGNGKK